MVAAAGALQRRHALPAQDAHLARLRTGREVELVVALERRDRQLRAARCLDDRQVDLREDVVAVALEALVAGNADLDVRVTWDATVRARVAGAADPDPLGVVDSGRDLDLELLRLDCAAISVASSAGGLDHRAGAETRWARLRADELAKDAAGDLLQVAVAAARLAGRPLSAGLGALAFATLAGDSDLDLDRARHAGEGIAELDPDCDADVTATRAPATITREEIVAEEGREDVAQV